MFEISYSLKTLDSAGLAHTEKVLPDQLQNRLLKYFDTEHTLFVDGVIKIFRRTIYKGLIFLLRRCPVQTGRLRGSFSTYLQKHGQQARYAAVADRPAMMSGDAGKSKAKQFDWKEFEDGMNTQGTVQEEPFHVVIGSNVEYGPGVELKHGFVMSTLLAISDWLRIDTEAWMKSCERKGWIGPVDENEQGSEQ